MTKIKEKKKIKCYWCDKAKGEAQKSLKKVWIGKGKKKRVEVRLVWEVQGFTPVYGERWICKKCAKNKCKRCEILLSNTKVCRCGIKHGAFYPGHPTYCKGCWKIISKEKNE